jgi:hypothetical protein
LLNALLIGLAVLLICALYLHVRGSLLYSTFDAILAGWLLVFILMVALLWFMVRDGSLH